MKCGPLVLGILGFFGGAGAGCGGNPYTEAAVATGVAVAATGVHRAITDDCWARCSPGYACNQESGLCEPGECDPSCPAGYMCSVTPTGNECQSTPLPLVNPVADPSVHTAHATDPAPSAASAPAASSLTPDRSDAGQVQIQRGNPGPTPASSVMFPLPQSSDVSGAPQQTTLDTPCAVPPAPTPGSGN